MYFEHCDCTVCLDICPDVQKVNEIRLEYIQARYPKNCDEENLLHYLKSLVVSSLILSTITSACNHKFHLKCILPLMKNDKISVKCPNCRREANVRESRDYDIVNSFQMIQFFHKILRDCINACKQENYQNLFPLTKIQQNADISSETSDAIYQAFIQFQRCLFSIAEQQSKRTFGTRLNFSPLELNEYISQQYFVTQSGHKLCI